MQDVPNKLPVDEEILTLREELAQAKANEAALRSQIAALSAQLGLARIAPAAPVPSGGRALIRRGRRVLRRAGGAVLRRVNRRLAARPVSGAGNGGGLSKETFRAQAQQALDAFLASGERLAFPETAEPLISILLVLYNQAPLTLLCLRSILATAASMPLRVVIVDNASSDQTSSLLERIDGAVIICNTDNRHFLLGVNQAAEHAAGPGLLLLNNDAMLRPGSLQAAWEVLNESASIGAVGGPIILPDATLQEAGSIIWNDGSCLGYGRGRNPADAEFQFRRDVDYCSGAFLLVRREAFEALGRLDTAFAPAYYEETDFCMRLREAGYRIVYEPRAAIDHFEFASSASNTSALALQAANHTKFKERHQESLRREHLPPGTAPLFARARGRFKGRVLVIDDRVPFPSLGAGYPRAAELTLALVEDGWFVTFYPLLTPDDSWDEIRALFPPSVEVALHEGIEGLRRFIESRDGYYNTILISRPHNMRILLDTVQARPAARLIYDAEAVFAQRSILQLTLEGTPPSPAKQQEMLDDEMSMARIADSIVTVSALEGALFEQAGCRDVHVLSHAQDPAPTRNGFDARSGFLFAGALDDDPSPNLDSLLWFAGDVLPLLTRGLPGDWSVQVAGRAGARRAKALHGGRIRILGRVPDLDGLYEAARVFIAPTRYAAGIPHKITEAAARGVPVVATTLLARQLGWTDGVELLTADTAEQFAKACARLHEDAALWTRLRDAAMRRIAEDYGSAPFRARVAAIMAPPDAAAGYEPAEWPSTASVPAAAAPPAVQAGTAAVLRYRLHRVMRIAKGGVRYMRRHGVQKTGQRVWLEVLKRSGKRGFALWTRLYDSLSEADLAAIRRHLGRLIDNPVFDLCIRWDGDEAALRATVASLQAQLYGRWTMRAAAGPVPPLPGWFTALAQEDARFQASPPSGRERGRAYTILLEPGDRLRPHALYLLAAEADAAPGSALYYADDEIAGPEETAAPHFYADWSEESLRDPCALDGLVAVRSDLLDISADTAADTLWRHRLWARALADVNPEDIRHIPHIAMRRRERPAPERAAWLDMVRAQCKNGAEAAETPHGPRIVYPLPEQAPLVSVIVPTKDQAALLRQCIEGVLHKTDYPSIEVIIVDNGSVEPATARILKTLSGDPRVTVLRDDSPFNYAALNNKAARLAKGDILALLNNDIAVREPGWLREMVSHLLRPQVGIAGAKLLYGNGTIQHAGVITGLHGGVASHIFRQFSPDAEGYDRRLVRVQDLSCVTAACLLVRREIYEGLGGMDERNLPVSYNDVDFCLRARQAGWRVIWTPFAVLDHLESISRGDDGHQANAERAHREYLYMLRHWERILGLDPAYNPNLSLDKEFDLAFPPRVRRPWTLYR